MDFLVTKSENFKGKRMGQKGRGARVAYVVDGREGKKNRLRVVGQFEKGITRGGGGVRKDP